MPGDRAVLIPFLSDPPSPIPEGTRVFKVGNSDRLGSGFNNDNDTISMYNLDGTVIDRIPYDCESENRLNCSSENGESLTIEGMSIERGDASDKESFSLQTPSPGADTSNIQGVANCNEGPS